MNSTPEDSSNAKLTDSLKALLIGGAIALASTQNSQAAAAPAKASDALDARIQKLRDQVRDTPATNVRVGKGPATVIGARRPRDPGAQKRYIA